MDTERFMMKAIPRDKEVEKALKRIKGEGIAIGHWILVAIRERLIREGKIKEEGK